jgi:hypothetical protein
MRTTLDIDDDVLFAAKDFARRDKKTLGATISSLIRRGLASPAAPPKKSKRRDKAATDDALAKLGIYPLPSRGGVVTNELINAIREQEGI